MMQVPAGIWGLPEAHSEKEQEEVSEDGGTIDPTVQEDASVPWTGRWLKKPL